MINPNRTVLAKMRTILGTASVNSVGTTAIIKISNWAKVTSVAKLGTGQGIARTKFAKFVVTAKMFISDEAQIPQLKGCTFLGN